MEINKLIKISTAYLKSTLYSTRRIYTYNWLWKYGILAYMQSMGKTEYSIEIGNDFILTCNVEGSIGSKHRDMIKSVIVLNDILKTGKIQGRRHIPVNYPLNGEIGIHAQKFIEHLTILRRSIKKVKDYKKRLSIFIDYLAENGVNNPDETNEDNIVAFILTHTHGCSKNITSVKSIEWEYEQEYRQVFMKKEVFENYPEKLVDIIFGSQTSKLDIDLVLDIIKNHYENLIISKMYLSIYSFDLGKMSFTYNQNKKYWVPDIWDGKCVK